VVGAPLEIGEQDGGLLVEMDRVIGDSRRAQQAREFGPEYVVAATVFGPDSGTS
jgi:hypothetical protein